jgi:phage shock protein C
MGLADEFQKLEELRQRGVLSDDEFTRAKARLFDGQTPPGGLVPAVAAINALRRSRSDRWLGGVCGGIARFTGVDSWVWRLIFAVLFWFGGMGLLAYVLMWIFVPPE